MHTDPSIARHAGLAGVSIPPLPDIAKSQPDPFDEVPDPRPVMTEKELSLNATVAGIRARSEAERQTASPEAMHALAAGAAAERGALDISGVASKPVSIAVIWVMELMDPFLRSLPESMAGDWAMLAWVLTNPEKALTAALEKRWSDIHREAVALALSDDISAEQGRSLDLWYAGEVARLRRITGAAGSQGTADAVGKPSGAPSP